MKITIFALTLTVLTMHLSCKVIKTMPGNLKQIRTGPLFESLSESLLPGQHGIKATMQTLQLLVKRQVLPKGHAVDMNWLNRVESKLDRLRASVNLRMAEMGIGSNRRNQMMGGPFRATGHKVNPFVGV